MPQLRRATQERLTSLPYQILMTVHVWYFGVFIVLIEAVLFVYKGFILPYPLGTWILEVLLLIFTAGTEAIRNFQGQKGNLTERLVPLVISLVLTLPLLFATLYFILWQTYVMQLEVITNSIHITFLVLEVIFGILVAVTLSRFKYAVFL